MLYIKYQCPDRRFDVKEIEDAPLSDGQYIMLQPTTLKTAYPGSQ